MDISRWMIAASMVLAACGGRAPNEIETTLPDHAEVVIPFTLIPRAALAVG